MLEMFTPQRADGGPGPTASQQRTNLSLKQTFSQQYASESRSRFFPIYTASGSQPWLLQRFQYTSVLEPEELRFKCMSHVNHLLSKGVKFGAISYTAIGK